MILLKHLSQGVLLVTGPFKVNGVPLRRVNARYVIATSAKVELNGIDEETLEKVGGEGYFTREKKKAKADEDSFFRQGEKPEASRFSFTLTEIWTLSKTNSKHNRRRKLQAPAQVTRRPLIRTS